MTRGLTCKCETPENNLHVAKIIEFSGWSNIKKKPAQVKSSFLYTIILSSCKSAASCSAYIPVSIWVSVFF
jgi:hypothetical protein